MNKIRRLAIADFLLIAAAAFILGGCGESTPPQSPAPANPSGFISDAEWSKFSEVAFAQVQQKAMAGDAGAQFSLGVMYRDGQGVPKDEAKAAEWYQKAAAQGNVNAQYSLGWSYDRGEGVPKDKQQAVVWYRKAAEQGYAPAQASLGFMYLFGLDVKDKQQAVVWYRKAAEQGNASAQFSLGFMYEDGQGVPKDEQQAVAWYRKAAEQGHAGAQESLGVMYDNGQGVPKDEQSAYFWLLLASTQGNQHHVKNRDIVERRLSPEQRATAQASARNWKPKKETPGFVDFDKPESASGSLVKKGTGTVFIVSKEGHAITNHHVVDGCSELRVEGREGVAKLVTADEVNDLALIKVPGNISATATIAANPAKLRQGEDIVVFGFPLNAVLSSGGNLTPGVVSAITGLGNNTNQIQITAPIQPGSSGSPALNKKGEVVGVVSMKLDDMKMAKATGQIGQNVNFAVSGQTLKTFLDTHKVEYRSGRLLSFEKSTADLADEARKWTLVVECWK